MSGFLSRLWIESDPAVRRRLIALYAFLAAANVAVWAWAYGALHGSPALFGSAVLAYALGLRHAVDADHIAAIDNATRKLMQQGDRPVGVGFFFSLGHALVVLLLSAAAGVAAAKVNAEFESLKAFGNIFGTLASAAFLFLLAAFNILVLTSMWRTLQAVRRGEPFCNGDFDVLLNNRGVLNRLFRPLFGLVTRSWHLFPIGFLFGLGFDTATEVALFGISAAQASASFSTVLVFPALFTAGMATIDSSDGVLMLGAYGWAFLKPIRKLYYNVAITAVSVAVAVLIGSIETLGLLGDRLKLRGAFWNGIGALNNHFGVIGYVVIGVFALGWLVSALIYRAKNDDAETAAQRES